ncbi:hypothetical protein LV779_02770 [Streptomyces thinghirensis]|nr:hypothetical protein [Streptomyces thinghirensis]
MIYSSGSCDDLPEHARPDGYLAPLTATPTEWVTVLGKPVQDRFDWGISSYLVPPAAREHALQEYTLEPGSDRRRGISTFYPEERTVFEEDCETKRSTRVLRTVSFPSRARRTDPGVRPLVPVVLDAIPRNDGSWYSSTMLAVITNWCAPGRTDTELCIDIAALPLRRLPRRALPPAGDPA